VALASFGVAFSLTLTAASMLMFLVKGGVLDVLLVAHESAGPFEREPLSIDSIEPAACFTLDRFIRGCGRLFRPYLALGFVLFLSYALTAGAYVAFAVYGYRAASGVLGVVGLTFLAAVAAVVLIVWVTLVNFVYLLMQIAMAADNRRLGDAFRAVVGFMRAEFRPLAQIFLVILAVEMGATLVSALAWSGLGLIAFVPLVGLAVIPLQIVALAVRGLAFAYIGLTAASAYLTLYRREPRAVAHSSRAVMAQRLGPPESGSVAG
jgi:magnesium-transporting ATPase (P-type)